MMTDEQDLPVDRAAVSMSLADVRLTDEEEAVIGTLNAPSQRPTRRMSLCSGVCMGIVLILSGSVGILTLGVLLTRSDRGGENPSTFETTVDRDDDSSTPSHPAQVHPQLSKVRAYLVANNVSNFAQLNTPDSPQYHATEWLALRDDSDSSLPADQAIYDYAYVSRYVLAVLYYATTNDKHDWSSPVSFATSRSICNWNGQKFAVGESHEGEVEVGGIRCDPVTQLPVRLDLEANHLKGSLPTELGLLTTLEYLDFEHNKQLTGSLPTELCQLTALKALALRNCGFSGRLPRCFGSMKQLELLFLGNNTLTGSLTSHHCGMTGLKELSLQGNQFNASLPHCVNKWSKIERINLSRNQFPGSLPADLSAWSNLEILHASENSFTGKLPSGMGKWRHLRLLDVAMNKLTGPLPSAPHWPRLISFVAHDNQFTGRLPHNFGAWKRLSILNLGNNRLKGELPASLGQRGDSLTELYLDDNHLRGNPIAILNNLTKLELMFVNDNHFQGPIDENFCRNTDSIRSVDLSNNNFTSSHLPDHLMVLPNLVILDLSRNNFVGTLPKYAPKESKLELFSIHGNAFNGTLPGKALYNLTRLIRLDFSDNEFSGTLPDDVFRFKRMKQLFLSNNPKLKQGHIPSTLSTMSQLSQISLSNTNRNGPLPQFNDFASLSLIDLDRNDLEGNIPESYGSSVVQLQYLLLSRNPKITGPLPDFKSQQLQTVLVDGTDVSGDFSALCALPKFKSKGPTTLPGDNIIVVAECGKGQQEISCECCYCCPNAGSCSNPVVESLDYTWERGFARQTRDFGLDMSSFVAPSQ